MDYLKLYADFLGRYLKPKRPLKIVFDCSNGTTGLVLEKLFADQQNCETTLLNKRPDGNFPAHGPNPMAEGAMDGLGREVAEKKADLGAVFDADGDRVFFVDDAGRKIEPAAAILLLGSRFKGAIALPVNIGPFVREQLAANGHETIDARVGHYFMKKLLKEKGSAFAAEQSGHYYFEHFFSLDSGILAAVEFINAVSELNMPLSAWVDQLPPRWISEEINFRVADKAAALAKLKSVYASAAAKVSELDGLSLQFADWWCNVRASNTENFLRLNLEARSGELFKTKLSEISDLLSSIK